MICWYCHWGWPKPVADIYFDALAELNGDRSPLDGGPGHIVFGEENFDDHSVRWCLSLYDPDTFWVMYPEHGTMRRMYEQRYSDQDLAVVKRALERMLELPASVRDPCPEDYDDECPELFPPPPGLEMFNGLQSDSYES